MLLATFQPYPNYDPEDILNPEETDVSLYEVPPRIPVTKKGDSHYKEFAEYLGYRPVFCFSAQDADDLWLYGTYAGPKRPERLIVFETDAYERLNLVEWNAMLWKVHSFEKKMQARVHQPVSAGMAFPPELLFDADADNDITKMFSEYIVNYRHLARVSGLYPGVAC